MKSICLIVPYFGKLPYNFQLWLEGCLHNQTINWIIFTNDTSTYDYPANVKVNYCEFIDLKNRIQQHFDFPITLETPYKLCDYRVAYGDVFSEELKCYDFWGYCDIDLMFGNLRKFFQDDLLDRYEKIGNQGHLTIYKNNEANRFRYRIEIPGEVSYREIFNSNKNYCFDEVIFDRFFEKLEIDTYKNIHFANLSKYMPDFFLTNRESIDEPEEFNKNQIFIWKNGELFRYYLVNSQIRIEECNYIHFFCRKMDIALETQKMVSKLLIKPNKIELLIRDDITVNFIKSNAHCSKFIFYMKYLYRSRNKISPAKLKEYFFLHKKFSRKM